MRMFRFSQWRPYGHDWKSWMSWFRRSSGSYAEVRRCGSFTVPPSERHRHAPREEGHTAIYVLGEDAFDLNPVEGLEVEDVDGSTVPLGNG
ncbi:MAG TPA: hypothetical protein PLB01_00130 [Thermoanaerobaculia bacterium]|nr:hypothetical protein [Thermoanaerobaculia bacterium]